VLLSQGIKRRGGTQAGIIRVQSAIRPSVVKAGGVLHDKEGDAKRSTRGNMNCQALQKKFLEGPFSARGKWREGKKASHASFKRKMGVTWKGGGGLKGGSKSCNNVRRTLNKKKQEGDGESSEKKEAVQGGKERQHQSQSEINKK